MAEKRAKKAAEEAKEALANEQIRRKSGKVNIRTASVCLVKTLTFRGFSRMSENYEMS